VSGLWGGAAVLAVGVVLLLDRLGIIPAREIFRFWPLVFVAGGLSLLIRTTGLTPRLMGACLVGAGLLVQTAYLGFFTIRGNVFWPFILIALGILMLGRAIEARSLPAPVATGTGEEPAAIDTEGSDTGPADREFRFGPFNTDGARVRSQVIFSSMERRVNVPDFESAKVEAVFGEFILDLRQSAISGPEARVKADGVFGSVEILVPENWEVILRGDGVFGAVNDETRHPDPSTQPKRLIVRAAAVFGAVRIANVPHR
jgi:predicted membrane protein